MSDHLKFRCHNRGAHGLQEGLLGRRMKVKGAGVICGIAMQVTESLLTLTSNTRKREFLLTVAVIALP